jgi:uncharacterized protein (TIGR00255 family)
MNSMTGFGRATGEHAGFALTVQVASVNRRSLDLDLKLPEAWAALEASVAEAVRKVAHRGKITLRVEAAPPAGATLDWDESAVAEDLERLAELAKARGIRFEPTADLLWQIARAEAGETGLPPADGAAPHVLRVVEEALRAFGAMRAKEGEALLVDFLTRLEKLHQHVEAVATRAPQVAPSYREQLLARLRQAGLALDVSDERVLKEVALFADRCDVTEELTRLRSHLKQLRDWLRQPGEVGRKAEFILQEIAREIHTLGVKANDLAVSQHVIEFKNELERIREQMANVE